MALICRYCLFVLHMQLLQQCKLTSPVDLCLAPTVSGTTLLSLLKLIPISAISPSVGKSIITGFSSCIRDQLFPYELLSKSCIVLQLLLKTLRFAESNRPRRVCVFHSTTCKWDTHTHRLLDSYDSVMSCSPEVSQSLPPSLPSRLPTDHGSHFSGSFSGPIRTTHQDKVSFN